MADSRLTALTALTAVASGDFFYVVDISDTTDDAAGSSKKATAANVFSSFGITLGATTDSTQFGLSSAIGTGTGHVIIGKGATTSGSSAPNCVAIGKDTTISGDTGGGGTVVIGGGSSFGGANGVIVGNGVNGGSANGTVVVGTTITHSLGALSAGNNLSTSNYGGINLGLENTITHVGATTIGGQLTSSRRNEFVIGHGPTGGSGSNTGGHRIRYMIESSTGTMRDGAIIDNTWVTATDASRLSTLTFSVFNISTAAPGLSIEAIGDSTVKNTLTGQLVQTGPARTGLTASTENIGVNINQSATKQFAAGALTTQREVLIQAPTYSFASGSNTITTASTVAITGAPIAGTNCAGITNPYALLVQQGKSLFTSDQGIPLSVQVTASASATIAEFGYNGGGGPSIQYNGFMCPGSRPYMINQGYYSYTGTHINLADDNIIRWTNFADTYNAYDTGLKRSAAGILEINNATAGQWAQLKLGTYDAGTTTITDGLTVGHRSSGTPAAGLGSAILFNIDSTTTADRAAGRLSFSWATATDASRLSKAAISVYDVSTSRDAIVCEAQSGNILNTLNGVLKITRIGTSEYATITKNPTNEGVAFTTGDNGGFGFYNVYTGDSAVITCRSVTGGLVASGIIQFYHYGSGLTHLSGAVIGWNSAQSGNLGGSATPDTALGCNAAGVVEVNNGTSGQWGQLKVGKRDSGTNTVTDGLTVGHQSSGTPAAGLGSAILFNIDSTTTADRNASRVQTSWTVATDASRTSEVGVKTVTNAGSLVEVARFDGGGGASPSAGNTGFMLWDVDNNTLERVTVGAADSGGTGYKVLRIPN